MRRHLVVDALEIGQRDGALTLRLGSTTTAPVCLAFPGPVAVMLVKHLAEARLDAEEEYWQVIPPRVQALGTTDPQVVSAKIGQWLLSLNWDRVVRATPQGPAFLVTYAGMVGLCAGEPFADEPLLAIIDPLQLQRLAPALQQAAAAAGDTLRVPGPADARVLANVRTSLKRQPWPTPGFPGPTPAEATTAMTTARRDFLAREPYLRPAHRDVHLDDVHLDQDPPPA